MKKDECGDGDDVVLGHQAHEAFRDKIRLDWSELVLLGSSHLIGVLVVAKVNPSLTTTLMYLVPFQVNTRKIKIILSPITLDPQAAPTVPTPKQTQGREGCNRCRPTTVSTWLDCTECGSRLHSHRHQRHHHEVR